MKTHMRVRRALMTAVAISIATVSSGTVWAAYEGDLDITRVAGTWSGNGGEFNITPQTGPATGAAGVNQGVGSALASSTFQSFCVEYNENISLGGNYLYNINTGAVKGGVSGQTSPNFDPLDSKTAYLYTEFINGTLTGDSGTPYNYTVGAGRAASAGDLQNAIWYIEGEVNSLSAGGADFYDAAVAANWQDIGNVRVLNLFSVDEGGGVIHNQDQLVMIPMPAAWLIGLPLLGFLGAMRFGFVRRKA